MYCLVPEEVWCLLLGYHGLHGCFLVPLHQLCGSHGQSGVPLQLGRLCLEERNNKEKLPEIAQDCQFERHNISLDVRHRELFPMGRGRESGERCYITQGCGEIPGEADGQADCTARPHISTQTLGRLLLDRLHPTSHRPPLTCHTICHLILARIKAI